MLQHGGCSGIGKPSTNEQHTTIQLLPHFIRSCERGNEGIKYETDKTKDTEKGEKIIKG